MALCLLVTGLCLFVTPFKNLEPCRLFIKLLKSALFDEEIDTSDEFNQDDLDIESTISQVSDQETVTTLVDEPNLLETESTDPFGDFDFGTF